MLPPAADGTKLSACADGTCEVRVDGPATIRIPKSARLTMQVVAIGDGAASLAFTLTGGGASFACEVPDTCSVRVTGSSATAPAVAQVTGYTGARAKLNSIRVEVVAVVGNSAVLRLSPA